MITLTKTYRMIWDNYTLNIQEGYDQEYAGITMFVPGSSSCFESDTWQDILDKIEEKSLNIPGEWVNPDGEDI